MQHMVHKLVLVSFLVHMAMGCCSHHAHGSSVDTDVPDAAVVCSHERCGHSHGLPADNSDEGDRQHEGCEGEQCEFVRGESVFPVGTSATWDSVSIATSTPSETLPSVGRFFSADLLRPPASLGLDILNQVMLL